MNKRSFALLAITLAVILAGCARVQIYPDATSYPTATISFESAPADYIMGTQLSVFDNSDDCSGLRRLVQGAKELKELRIQVPAEQEFSFWWIYLYSRSYLVAGGSMSVNENYCEIVSTFLPKAGGNYRIRGTALPKSCASDVFEIDSSGTSIPVQTEHRNRKGNPFFENGSWCKKRAVDETNNPQSTVGSPASR